MKPILSFPAAGAAIVAAATANTEIAAAITIRFFIGILRVRKTGISVPANDTPVARICRLEFSDPAQRPSRATLARQTRRCRAYVKSIPVRRRLQDTAGTTSIAAVCRDRALAQKVVEKSRRRTDTRRPQV